MEIPSSFFAVQIINNKQSNTQIRFYQNETCLFVSIFGPSSVSASRASLEGILEIQVKMDTAMDTTHQKALEWTVRQLFCKIINLQEYMQQMIKIVVVVQSNQGNLESAVINGIQIALLHHGLSLQTTVFAAEFSREMKSFPTLEEQSDITAVVSLSTGKFLSLSQNSFNTLHKDLDQMMVSGAETYKQWLKNHLYNQMVLSGVL